MNRELLLRDDLRVFADEVRVLGLGPSLAATRASPLTRKIAEQHGDDRRAKEAHRCREAEIYS